MKVAFYTLGCKVNQYDTDVMIEKLKQANYEIVDFDGEADIYVINTCTVTNISDRKSRQMMKRTKKINEKSILVVTGCYAQVGKDELSKFEEIDVILGNEEKKEIEKYLKQYFEIKTKIYVQDIMKQKEYSFEGISTSYEKRRVAVKIQDGCNNYCSYCIIPYARGNIRSKNQDLVIDEVTSIVNNGYKEIVLTGIHISSYGKENGESSLIDILEKLNNIEGLERIRLGSLEPTIITKEFLDRMSRLEKVCHHFHLSLQSACNITLKRMNRKYTIEQYIDIVNLIREYYKDANITTDIIVGFPGETEEEFNVTYSNLSKLNLSKLHVFKYSVRKGTKAANMENQINPELKEKRSNILLELSDKCEQEYLNSYIGKDVEILIEEVNDNLSKGYTKNYIMTKLNSAYEENLIINAKCIDVKDFVLICEKNN